MGTPGVGKGTQARLLTERFGIAHVSTGEILREAVQADSPLGREARQYLDQGLLVPDEVVTGIVETRLAAPDCARGFVLDGFPRTVEQAEALDAMLVGRAEALDAVVHVAVPRAEVMRRLARRRSCPQCGATFHILSKAPTVADRCDRCGGALVGRSDDGEETVARRMGVYAKQTAPVLDYYARRGLLREVVGTGTPAEVFARVTASLA